MAGQHFTWIERKGELVLSCDQHPRRKLVVKQEPTDRADANHEFRIVAECSTCTKDASSRAQRRKGIVRLALGSIPISRKLALD